MKSKKNNIVVVVYLCVLVFAIFGIVWLQEQESVENVRFVVEDSRNFSEKISLFKNDGKYYLFLPSYANIEEISVEYPYGCSLYINEKKVVSSSICADLQLNKEYELIIKNFFGISILKEGLVILKSENLPTFSISLTDGTIQDVNQNKAVEKTGRCTIHTAEGENIYQGEFDKIHGRGGYTWSQAKKPYNISFPQDVDLLGMGKAKKWILLSNPLDMSNLRNKIVYDAASRLGLKFSVDSRFVDLYIDETYYGLYLLTEKIEVNENRIEICDLYDETQVVNNAKLDTYEENIVEEGMIYTKSYNIPNNPVDITGGYVLELQHWEGRNTLNSSFSTKSKNCFELKSVPYATNEQIKYISNYVQKVEDSIIIGDYEKYIDIDSWTKYYLIQEVFGNMDNRSFFYYKDKDAIDEKLYAGPVWDFDVSLGNHSVGPEINPEAFYVNTWGWYSILYQDSEFKNEIIATYKDEVKKQIKQIVDSYIYEYGDLIESSYVMNRYRWLGIQSTNRSDGFETLSENIEWIRTYLIKREQFLDYVWLENQEVCTVSAVSKKTDVEYSHKYYYSISCGSAFDALPVLSAEGYVFQGWYDSETNEKYVPGEVIVSNKSYTAKWILEDNIDEMQEETMFAMFMRIIKNNASLLLVLSGMMVIGCSIIFFVLNDMIDLKSKKGDKNGR